MSAVKVRFPENRPLARLCFKDDGPYPGWFVRYRMKGKRRKLALHTWDRGDVEDARDEAAKLLRIPSDRVIAE